MMMARIAVVQMGVTPGGVERNLARAVELIAEAGGRDAELVVLPEMALAGLPDDIAAAAQEIPGPATDRLSEAAAEIGAWVVAGLPEANPVGNPFNAAVAIDPSGEIAAVYRKVFLYLQEAEGFARGCVACLLDLGFAQAGLTICYDYIFPEYLRSLATAGAQMLLHPTAWVDTQAGREWGYPSAEAYRAQCMTRALENQVFFASANILGTYDEGGYLEGVGRSSIIAPWGEVLAEVPEGEGVAVADCDFSRVEAWCEEVAPYMHDYRSVDVPKI
jgi:predicted amidohydrolase